MDNAVCVQQTFVFLRYSTGVFPMLGLTGMYGTDESSGLTCFCDGSLGGLMQGSVEIERLAAW